MNQKSKLTLVVLAGIFAHVAIADSHSQYFASWDGSGSDRSLDPSLVAHVGQQTRAVLPYEGELEEVEEQSGGASITDVINNINVKEIPWWGWLIIGGIGEVILSKIFK